MPHRLPQLLRIGAVLIGVASMLAPARTATAAGPALAVSPTSANAVVGADVTLDITVADVPASPGIGGYLVVLKWDPAFLSLTSLSDSGWVTGGDIIVVCDAPTIDNGAGTAFLLCNPALPFGDGVTTVTPRSLAQATFYAKSPGTTPVDLAGSYLLNKSNVKVTPALANGSVTVAAPATATPVPATGTPAATNTAAASATVTAVASATSTAPPAAVATSNDTAISTNPAGGTLSNVEAPRTGSGDASEGSNRTAWWVAGVAATAVVVTAGGAAAYGWRRGHSRSRRTGD